VCPVCGFAKREKMQTDACGFFTNAMAASLNRKIP
jgi:hypothetical protein